MKHLFFLFAFILALSLTLWPQQVQKAEIEAQSSQNLPLWFLYQQSLSEFRKGNVTESVTYLKKIQEEHGEIPEALVLMGRVYEKEGEIRIAEQFYQRALELGKQFYILEEKYNVYYWLANLYAIQKRYKDYEKILLELLSFHPESGGRDFVRFRDAVLQSMINRGIETTLQLYRLKQDFATRANLLLGIFYCRTHRSDKAILHLTLGQIAIFSALIEEWRLIDPNYQFKDLETLLSQTIRRPSLRQYLEESRAWEGMYYLAASFFLNGLRDPAKELWEVTARYGDGEWKLRSERQLKNPQREPMIGY
ncbi:MAG: hypothetical protein SNJ78_02900 [Spirochaetales bacterium]